MATNDGSLTDQEGPVLALVLRQQPITPYQIASYFERSPMVIFGTSHGKLYPLIRRLQSQGYLEGEVSTGDGRRATQLRLTDLGRTALKAWIETLRPEHDLTHDPLRKKVLAFDLLTRDEQIRWIETTRSRFAIKLDEIERAPIDGAGPYGEFLRMNAAIAVQGRLEWLDELFKQIPKASNRNPAG
jgi:DNA-binding PadR family transcriptional regulator